MRLGSTEPHVPGTRGCGSPSPQPASCHASVLHLPPASELASLHLLLEGVKTWVGWGELRYNSAVSPTRCYPRGSWETRGNQIGFPVCIQVSLVLRTPGVSSAPRRTRPSGRTRAPSAQAARAFPLFASAQIRLSSSAQKGQERYFCGTSLAQTFFPQDCLGLPSNLTALCLSRHTTRMDFSYF